MVFWRAAKTISHLRQKPGAAGAREIRMKDIRPGTTEQLIFIGMLFGKAHISFDGFL
jgi:hypothetical protein